MPDPANMQVNAGPGGTRSRVYSSKEVRHSTPRHLPPIISASRRQYFFLRPTFMHDPLAKALGKIIAVLPRWLQQKIATAGLHRLWINGDQLS
jgi:hypothetical protein